MNEIHVLRLMLSTSSNHLKTQLSSKLVHMNYKSKHWIMVNYLTIVSNQWNSLTNQQLSLEYWQMDLSTCNACIILWIFQISLETPIFQLSHSIVCLLSSHYIKTSLATPFKQTQFSSPPVINSFKSKSDFAKQ